MNQKILITASIKEEFVYVINYAEKLEYKKVGGRSVVYGRLFDKRICLLTTGPGLVNTAQAISTFIEYDKPSFIIQIGCAGGFKQAGMKIGDIGISTKEIDVQAGIEPENIGSKNIDLPFFLLSKSGMYYKNEFPFDEEIVDKIHQIIESEMSGKNYSIKKGPFTTVSTITATDERAQFLFNNYEPIIESMEGSAFAHIALYYDIPAIEIRSVSNITGKRDKRSWNQPLAYERSGKAIIALLKNYSL